MDNGQDDGREERCSFTGFRAAPASLGRSDAGLGDASSMGRVCCVMIQDESDLVSPNFFCSSEYIVSAAGPAATHQAWERDVVRREQMLLLPWLIRSPMRCRRSSAITSKLQLIPLVPFWQKLSYSAYQ